MRRAGVHGPQAGANGLRHGYAAAAVERAVPLTTIDGVLGHAIPSTTIIYGRTAGREACDFVSRLRDDSLTTPKSTNDP